MIKADFDKNSDVLGFKDFLIKNLPTMRFDLHFKHSKFVPEGIRQRVEGFTSLQDPQIYGNTALPL